MPRTQRAELPGVSYPYHIMAGGYDAAMNYHRSSRTESEMRRDAIKKLDQWADMWRKYDSRIYEWIISEGRDAVNQSVSAGHHVIIEVPHVPTPHIIRLWKGDKNQPPHLEKDKR